MQAKTISAGFAPKVGALKASAASPAIRGHFSAQGRVHVGDITLSRVSRRISKEHISVDDSHLSQIAKLSLNIDYETKDPAAPRRAGLYLSRTIRAHFLHASDLQLQQP
jgi:hypothetical protein